MRFSATSGITLLLSAVAVAIFAAVAAPGESNRTDDLPEFRPAARAAKRTEAPVARDDVEPAPVPDVAYVLLPRAEPTYTEPPRRGRETHLRLGVLLI